MLPLTATETSQLVQAKENPTAIVFEECVIVLASLRACVCVCVCVRAYRSGPWSVEGSFIDEIVNETVPKNKVVFHHTTHAANNKLARNLGPI